MTSPTQTAEEYLKHHIRDIPDFPIPGILFRDITPLLSHPEAFRRSIDALAAPFVGMGIEQVVAVEARGYIFAAPIAYQLNAGLVPVRKPGKLPHLTIRQEYALEYGTNTLEIHSDAIKPGQKVLIVDDVIATGGSAKATVDLVQKLGGTVQGLAFLIELEFLNGRRVIDPLSVHSVVKY